MRRTAGIWLALVFLLALANAALARPLRQPASGTIRGGVYEDINGDGRCLNTGLESRKGVSGVSIRFRSGGANLTLYTGADGTYGLIPASQGVWQVSARPNPARWLLTSINPIEVPVRPAEGLVQTEINFCVQPLTGLNLTSLPIEAISSVDWPALGQVDSATAASAGDQSDIDDGPLIVEPLTAAERRALISEVLLTNPPPPQPPEDIAGTLDIAVDADAPPVPEWLGYLNLFREMGGLSPLGQTDPLTFGSQWHSRYMVVNDEPIAHSEDQNNVLFDEAGDRAARNGNIFATTQLEADQAWAINFWISAPFHLVPILDPQLGAVGFGQSNEDVGTFTMAAVLDVRSQLPEGQVEATYPIFFPGDGSETWIVRHSLFEWPDPMASCPGYRRPSGPALVLQLGDGSITPNVSGHVVLMDGRQIESCLFDETSYSNPNAYAQSTGRTILDERDAVVIIPRQPLEGGRTYTVQVDANGQSYSWQFTTGSPPK